MKNNMHQRGFTLVEMIVVIAIIAILAAVIIPTTAGFIDRARLSNDRSTAAYMNRALQAMFIEDEKLAGEALTAHDVKELLDNFADEPFDFTPSSRNAGYFYIQETRRVVVSKYGEAAGGSLLASATFNPNRFLTSQSVQANSVDWDQVRHPEELFGQGTHLLTTEGSLVAIAVTIIRNYADNPIPWDQIKDLTWGSSTVGLLLLGGTLEGHLDTLMDTFKPENTLYVGPSGWYVDEPEESKTRLVFTPGISSIPEYDGEVVELGNSLKTIVLPRTVRDIEANAFTRMTHLEKVTIPAGQTVRVHAEAILESVTISGGEQRPWVASNIVDYSNHVTINASTMRVELGDLPIRASVIGYRINVRQDVVRIYIYTDEGLVGYADNLYRVTYHLNINPIDHTYNFFQVQRPGNQFVLAPEPSRIGYTFKGWSLDPNADPTEGPFIQKDDELGNRLTQVYAVWEED